MKYGSFSDDTQLYVSVLSIILIQSNKSHCRFAVALVIFRKNIMDALMRLITFRFGVDIKGNCTKKYKTFNDLLNKDTNTGYGHTIVKDTHN